MKSNVRKWFAGLSKAGKITTIGAASLVLLGGIGAVADPCEVTYANKTVSESVPFDVEVTKDPTLSVGESKVQKPGLKGENQVTYKVGSKCNKQVSQDVVKTVVKKQPIAQQEIHGSKQVTDQTEDADIPFANQNVSDPSMNQGTSKIVQNGVNGKKRLTYEVVAVDGRQQSRTQIKEEVVVPPINQITHIGTKVSYSAPSPSNCDSNYSGGCVPIASDVDCGGGSGNGPAYFYGTARVVGYDIYGLDRDGDGLACE